MGFPLEKALAYAKLRNPLLINDLESQYNLLDRYGIWFHLFQLVNSISGSLQLSLGDGLCKEFYSPALNRMLFFNI